jgi:hypothetical protein
MRVGYGDIGYDDERERKVRRRAQANTPTPEVTPQWLLEDRRDEALTCWPYKAGGR